MRHVSTSVNWGDVAYYFGVLAFIAAIFAIRFGDFRRRCIERFDIDGYRAALAFMAIIYGLFVVCGIVLIVKAARA